MQYAILNSAVHPGDTDGLDAGTNGLILVIVGAAAIVVEIMCLGTRQHMHVAMYGSRGRLAPLVATLRRNVADAPSAGAPVIGRHYHWQGIYTEAGTATMRVGDERSPSRP